MPQQPGQDLLHYRLGEKLGEGGMGTVYRARDGKLGRDVALKFLPDAFSEDADRMARFTREAQLLASLNHPHIAGIHAVEELPAAQADDGATHRFLVMELVEGETLEERIARGPVPLDEALRITLQIATGLEEAHERGIIHRDLKPANVKLTPGKQVKILDFGLAKAFEAGAGADPASSGVSGSRLSLSPTMTAGASQAGMLLGTAAYMSPEQARAEPADRRCDIWALGVVLMEMITGQRVHAGKTMSDTLASVLAREPDWGRLPADTPRTVRRLLERCLEKDSHQRLRDVGEARIAIEHFLAGPEEQDPAAEAPAPLAAPVWRRAVPWALTGALAIAALLMLPGALTGPPPPPDPVRLSLNLPEGASLFTGYGASAVLSPDGSRLAYVVGPGNSTGLQTRSLDQWQGTSLVQGDSGDRPYQPFFSPDGQWLGFVTPGEMRKMPVSGGTPIKLCSLDRNRGATWGPDGTIVFASSPASGLMQVPAAGGEPRPFTELDADGNDRTHRWPQWLPGGKGLIFTSHSKLSDFDEASIEAFNPATGERHVLVQGGTYGRFFAGRDGSGYLVYANAGSLFAVPFDPNSMELTGSAAPVVEGVTTSPSEGSAQFETALDGTLVYSSGNAGMAGHLVAWIDREGRTEPLWEEERYYRNPAFSPDGTRLAVEIAAEGQSDIWVHDLERGVTTRLTFSQSDDNNPIWSPDGRTIVYTAEVEGKRVIRRKASDGSGDFELVYEAETSVTATSLSADGRLLSFSIVIPDPDQRMNRDIGILDLEKPGEPRMLVQSPFMELIGRLSPNGRWLAYASNESGSYEAYVRAVDGPGKWQISSGGAFWHHWSPDGRELFYANGRDIYIADVETDGEVFRSGRPRRLLENVLLDVGLASPFAPAPDAQRFAVFRMRTAEAADSHQHLQTILNWDVELARTFGR